MANPVNYPGSRLDGLSADLFHKLQSGALTEDQLALFLKKKNPFKLKRGEEKFDCAAHFITGPGLWVDSDFTKVAIQFGMVTKRSALELKAPITLPRNMSDGEICRNLLGGEAQARENAVCLSQIWELVQAQPGGTVGKLLNNGYANIFYVVKGKVLFSVRVRWHSLGQKWEVECWKFVQPGYWRQDCQVFSN